ncbi:UNVERIFIED_CONTAM: hypothetical protein K2H54_035776 [Gekko kuhli]
MAATEETKGEELNEDVEIGTLTVEQFRAILLEGIQKGVGKALKNLFEKPQTQYLNAENKDKLEPTGQSFKEEQQKEQNIEENSEKVLEKTQTLTATNEQNNANKRSSQKMQQHFTTQRQRRGKRNREKGANCLKGRKDVL